MQMHVRFIRMEVGHQRYPKVCLSRLSRLSSGAQPTDLPCFFYGACYTKIYFVQGAIQTGWTGLDWAGLG